MEARTPPNTGVARVIRRRVKEKAVNRSAADARHALVDNLFPVTERHEEIERAEKGVFDEGLLEGLAGG